MAHTTQEVGLGHVGALQAFGVLVLTAELGVLGVGAHHEHHQCRNQVQAETARQHHVALRHHRLRGEPNVHVVAVRGCFQPIAIGAIETAPRKAVRAFAGIQGKQRGKRIPALSRKRGNVRCQNAVFVGDGDGSVLAKHVVVEHGVEQRLAAVKVALFHMANPYQHATGKVLGRASGEIVGAISLGSTRKVILRRILHQVGIAIAVFERRGNRAYRIGIPHLANYLAVGVHQEHRPQVHLVQVLTNGGFVGSRGNVKPAVQLFELFPYRGFASGLRAVDVRLVALDAFPGKRYGVLRRLGCAAQGLVGKDEIGCCKQHHANCNPDGEKRNGPFLGFRGFEICNVIDHCLPRPQLIQGQAHSLQPHAQPFRRSACRPALR